MKRTLLKFTLTLIILFTIFSVSALAQGKFIYTNNDRRISNSVSGFKVNAKGSIELLPGMPVQTGDGGGAVFETLGSSQKVAIAAKGPYLFAANDDEQTITVFKIDPATGALTYIETEDIGGGDGGDSIAMTISPDEQVLYAGNPNHDRIHVLRIFDDGTLAEIEVEQLAEGYNATDLKVSPNGKFLVATLFHEPADINGRLAVYSIDPPLGAITPVEGSPFKGSDVGRVGNAIFNCEGNLLFVAKEFTSKLSFDVFNFSPQGSLSLIDGAPFVFNIEDHGGRIALSPNGKFLYTEGGLGEVHALQVHQNGELELVVFSPFPTTYQKNQVSDFAFDSAGKYLFVSYSDQHVESLRINPDGSLSTIENGLAYTNEDNGVSQSHLHSLVAFPLPKKCKIKVPDDITINNAQFVCGNDVDYTVSTCGNDCGTVNCDPPSGTFFPVGTTVVTCSAQGLDDAQFTITVKDIDAPKINCPENITVSTEANKCSAKVNFKITATDFCDANPVIDIDFPSGTEFPKGTTTVHIKATDKAGNFSNCVFDVKVVDAQAPTINCQADIVVNNEPNKCGAVVAYALPNVSDNCPGVGAPTCNPPSGTFFPIGTTMVQCSVSDASGNGSPCTFKVTVKDVQPPQITCPADKTVVTASACDASVVVTYPAPMVLDNCPNNLAAICNPPSGSIFPLGATTVTCTATDGGGNQAQCSFKVTVFNAWLQDESNPATVLLFNTVSGEYRLCYPGVNQPITGVGTIVKKGCMATLEHNAADRRLLAKVDPATKKGTASYQSPPGSLKCTITDQDITNNSNLCQ